MRLHHLATTALCLVACAPDPDTREVASTSTDSVTRRDSAGIAIVEYPASILTTAPVITLDSIPLATIGGDDSKIEVFYLLSAAFLSDGRIAALDFYPGRHSIHLFAADGKEIRTLGRSGEGPGEFGDDVGGLSWGSGDTLAVSDASLFRVTIYHPDSGLMRMQPAKIKHFAASYSTSGRLANGNWLMQPYGWVVVGSGAHKVGEEPARVPIGFLPLTSTREHFDSLGSVPGIETVYTDKRKTGVALPRFAPMPLVIAWNGKAAVMENRAWRIEQLDPLGKLVGVVRVNTPPRVVTSAMIDTIIHKELAQRQSRRGKRASNVMTDEESALGEWPNKESLPAFGLPFVSPDGILWVPDYIGPTDTALIYTAIAPDATILGRLSLPVDTEVRAFGIGRVLVLKKDADDVRRLEVLKVKMP